MADQPRVLLTGFGPFPGVDENPTELIAEHARRLGDNALAGIELRVEVLPSEYEAVVPLIRALVIDEAPDVIVLTGLRTSSDDVCVERVAINVDDCDQPDNAGELRRGTAILDGGAPAFISDLDLDRLVGEFTGRDVVARVSNHAGAYICNRIYYLARNALAEASRSTPCVFVHVPWANRREIATVSGAPLTVEALTEGVLGCARALL